MSHSPQNRIGIDIGSGTIHVATTYDLDHEGKPIPPHVLDISTNTWWQELLTLCAPNSIAVCEPTGWHYSAAIVQLLHDAGVHTYYADHNAAHDARRFVKKANHKSDANDARALCLIAHHINGTEQPSGVTAADPTRLSASIQLRTLIRAYERATKDKTRATNRLRQLAHAIYPTLGIRLEIYLTCIRHGATHPEEIRQLAQNIEEGKFSFGKGKNNSHIKDLAASLPPNLSRHRIAEVLGMEVSVLEAAQQRAAVIQQHIKDLIQQPPLDRLTALWQTVPAPSLIDIAKLHAANYGNSEYLTLAQFKANLGSFPATIKQSGNEEFIAATYKGYKPAKIALTLWTLRLCKTDNPVSRKFKAAQQRRAVNQKGKSKAQAIARGKLIEILHSIARTERPYFDPEERNK